MSDKIRAPFTEAQIAALNAYQRSGRMHPFTCGNEAHELHQTLIAERDGWHCPDEHCDYRQDWAHPWMADPNFVTAVERPGVAEHLAVFQAAERAYGSPVMAELRKTQGQLRVTEEELALERAKTAALRKELRMIEAVRQLSGRPLVPEQTAGDCDATWMPRNITDVHLPEEMPRA
jgi:hypothetical protein